MNHVVDDLNLVQEFCKQSRTNLFLKNTSSRLFVLKKIKSWIKENLNSILEALEKDLNKSAAEALLSEVLVVLKQIKYYEKNLKKFTKPKIIKESGLFGIASKTEVFYKPLGLVLIISPFNYPFHLTLLPLITALAAGNFVILKNSPKTLHTSQILFKMVNDLGFNNIICFLKEDLSEHDLLTIISFQPNLIFFTGSQQFGNFLKREADRHNIPIVLELGSANPVIVDETADLDLTAKRLVWGKLFNMGQTCVAPNTVFCHQSKIESLAEKIQEQLLVQYKTDKYPFVKMVDLDSLQRVCATVFQATGVELEHNEQTLTIKPTLIRIENDAAIAHSEIFGPVLFLAPYDDLNQFMEQYKEQINHNLTLYLFTTKKDVVQDFAINYFDFGSICVNETIIHAGNVKIPFGGIGKSGTGKYHGSAGLQTFSYLTSITKGVTKEQNKRYFPHLNRYKKLFYFLAKTM